MPVPSHKHVDECSHRCRSSSISLHHDDKFKEIHPFHKMEAIVSIILISIPITTGLLFIPIGPLRLIRSTIGNHYRSSYLCAIPLQNQGLLHFMASSICRTRSSSKPLGGEKALQHFFSSDENRNQLLIGSGNMHITESHKPLNATLLVDRWKDELKFFKLGLPTNETHPKFIMLSVCTNFLIFAIFVDAVVSVELRVVNRPSHYYKAFPEYQFMLLQESFRADGPPPMVWLFNKLTVLDSRMDFDNTSSHEHQNHTNHVFFKVSVEETSNTTISFIAQTKADISFYFPSVLLNLLPVSSEIIEEQGSSALKNSMIKDVSPGLESFLQSYVMWLQGQTSGSESPLTRPTL